MQTNCPSTKIPSLLHNMEASSILCVVKMMPLSRFASLTTFQRFCRLAGSRPVDGSSMYTTAQYHDANKSTTTTTHDFHDKFGARLFLLEKRPAGVLCLISSSLGKYVVYIYTVYTITLYFNSKRNMHAAFTFRFHHTAS